MMQFFKRNIETAVGIEMVRWRDKGVHTGTTQCKGNTYHVFNITVMQAEKADQ